MAKKSSTFEDFLTEDDYGFIVCSKTGTLKGLWVPEGQEHVSVPDTIVNICKEYFGLDPNEYPDEDVTIH